MATTVTLYINDIQSAASMEVVPGSRYIYGGGTIYTAEYTKLDYLVHLLLHSLQYVYNDTSLNLGCAFVNLQRDRNIT